MTIHIGDWIDVLRTMPDESVHCCVTSPPYWGLRDYGVTGQLGLEHTPEEYVTKLVEGFREVKRVLTMDGTLWLNLGDSYNAAGRVGHGTRVGFKQDTNRASHNGHDNCRPTAPKLKPKDLIGIPWMVAFALRADGWYLRQDIIWAKGTSGEVREGNIMPESVRDRCSKAHEYIFLLSKGAQYYYDNKAVKEPAKDWGTRDRSNWRGGTTDPKLKHHGFEKCNHPLGNRRSVWRINPTPYKGAHFATFPPKLIEPCVLAGCPKGGIVLDPFAGSGTTGQVAMALGRDFVLIDANKEYLPFMQARTGAAVTAENQSLVPSTAPPHHR